MWMNSLSSAWWQWGSVSEGWQHQEIKAGYIFPRLWLRFPNNQCPWAMLKGSVQRINFLPPNLYLGSSGYWNPLNWRNSLPLSQSDEVLSSWSLTCQEGREEGRRISGSFLWVCQHLFSAKLICTCRFVCLEEFTGSAALFWWQNLPLVSLSQL